MRNKINKIYNYSNHALTYLLEKQMSLDLYVNIFNTYMLLVHD